ncbi:hypothetical protein QTI66_29005 [Variovorax sp. J22R133]|uniref:hypothetical protein n=1 Tax=Variovorax brevis TaxID=3053503 RepID=UPI00257606A2|nr:hypothetical protein [Variovorax sp. J22R133]MDM0116210.1 hypothetical protein [Variovorax sp. J22R133]
MTPELSEYMTTEELATTFRVKKCTIEKRRYRGLALPPEHHFPGMRRTLYKRSEADNKETWVPAGRRPQKS